MNKILRLCAALEEKVKVDFGQLNIRKQSFGPDFYVFAQLRKATYRNTNKYTIGKLQVFQHLHLVHLFCLVLFVCF